MALPAVAAYCGVSTATVRRWITRGLPCYRAGGCGRILVKPADIDRYLTRRQAAVPDLDALVDEVMGGLAVK